MRNHQVATQIKSPTLKQPNIYVTSHKLQNLILTYLQKQHSAPVFLPFVWVVLQGQLAICFSYLWKFHAEKITVMHWLEQTEAILRQHFGTDTFLHLMIKQTHKQLDDSWCWCSKIPYKTNKTNNSSCLVAQNWPKNAGSQASWMLLVGSNPNLGCERIGKSILLMEETFSTSWWVVNPMISRALSIPAGAGFLPSTGCPKLSGVYVFSSASCQKTSEKVKIKVGILETRKKDGDWDHWEG